MGKILGSMGNKLRITFVLICFCGKLNAQLESYWRDTLFRIYAGAPFDYFAPEIKKHHIESIELYRVSVTGVSTKHLRTDLMAKNLYNEEGRLCKNIDSSISDFKVREMNITHPGSGITHFNSINVYHNGKADTILEIYEVKSSSNSTDSGFKNGILIGGKRDEIHGDTMYSFLLHPNNHSKSEDTSYSIWSHNKYCKIEREGCCYYNYFEPNLKIYLDKSTPTIYQRINRKLVRETIVYVENDGSVTGALTVDYCFLHGKISKIVYAERKWVYIKFNYGKNKMLQSVYTLDPNGKISEGYIYKYNYFK